jgi:tight adherence protein B
VAIAVGGLALALLFPWLTGSAAASKRIARVADKSPAKPRAGLRARFAEESKDVRRKQIQESLKQFEEREKQRNKRATVKLCCCAPASRFRFASSGSVDRGRGAVRRPWPI